MIRRRRLRSAAPCRFIAGVPGVLDNYGLVLVLFQKNSPVGFGPSRRPPGKAANVLNERKESSKMARDGLQDGQDGLQYVSKTAKMASKTAQMAAKTAQDAPKTA